MCGFAGILHHGPPAADGAAARRAVIERMTATLAPRGPDAGGVHLEDRVSLGHRRLSILDLTAAGAQPMSLGTDGPIVTFNGEIYNFADLRRELEAGGAVFRSHSDTEVILHAYRAWGLAGLERLEGIFGFALWDRSRDRLVIARDRLGVKPVYYAECTDGIAFGSEIKAVLAAGGVDDTLDEQAFAEFLWYGNALETRSFYRGVRALAPGHRLVIEGGRQRLQSWFRIETWATRAGQPTSFAEGSEALRGAVDAAVRRQLVADVPVGIFLSGGVDSSTIAAAAMAVQERPLASFAAAFDFDEGVDELAKARTVAGHLRLDHHELRIAGGDLREVLVELARAHDEPFSDAANVPLYLMCKALGGRIKVVLQGDGGDELFAGYRRYQVLRNVGWWRRWPRRVTPILRTLGTPARRFARIADAAGDADPALRMARLLTVETAENPPESMLVPERRVALAAGTDPFLAYRNAARRFSGFEPVQQMLLTDLTVELASTFLPKVDRATMAAGVEARVPLLDERVAELAVGMHSSWKVEGAHKKIVLRDSQRSRLPAAILDGPKTGFGVPFGYWLCAPLAEFARERMLDRATLDHFGLDHNAVERALRRVGPHDHRTFTLWKILQLALWKQSRCRHHAP